MIVNHLDLDIAVAEGVISRDQAIRLRDLSVRDLAGDDSSIDFSQDMRDEPFRLLRGFRDVFIAIGVVILAGGLSTIALTLAGSRGILRGYFVHIDDGSGWYILITFILCIFGIAQAELITRKMRLPLSSFVVSIAFAAWSAGLFASISPFVAFVVTVDPVQASQVAESIVGWAALAGAILGTLFFYWRYRLPFALFLLAGSLVGLSLLITENIMGNQRFVEYDRMLFGLWGLVIFVVAMWFDVKDRIRVTRFSECAFWLHLIAAPMMVHAFLFGDPLGAPKLGFVFGVMAALSVIALLIDRRALLVSGLSYFAVAISQLVSSSSFMDDQNFAFTAVILGGVMLALGLGWTPVRRAVLGALPFNSLKSLLPPTAA